MRSTRNQKPINYKDLSSDDGLDAADEDNPQSVTTGTESEAADTDIDDADNNIFEGSTLIEPGASWQSSPEIKLTPWQYDSDKTGFMDLPVEIRLSIYKLALVTKDCVEFGRRINFPHSSALLSVNRTVAREAAPVLYGMNKFFLRPCGSLRGSFWVTQWTWVGYKIIREFLEMIGPTNLSLLRTIFLKFDDATPSDEPKLTLENRRFQYNEDLSRSLELLAKYATGLELLKVAFCGRQKFRRGDSVATQNLTKILVKLKADVVLFEDLYINRYSNRASNSFDLWPYEEGRAHWSHHPRENKLDCKNQDFFKEKMLRTEPLNLKVITAFETALEEGEKLKRKHKLEGRPFIWY